MGTRRIRVSVGSGRSKLDRWDDLGMQVFTNPTQNEIKIAAKSLKEGHLVAFPTETVYGLGADAANEKAVGRIYSVKGRPTDHPLIVHISSINQLDKWAIDIPDYATKLTNEFWPGPMTLILKRSDSVGNFITGGQDSVGVRVPAHQVALTLLGEFEKLGGLGVVAPSANKFGAVSPTNSSAVVEEIGLNLMSEDLILDGGNSFVGIESTIIDCTTYTPTILRPGAITAEMIAGFTKLKPNISDNKSKIKVSGLLDSHYAPIAKVALGTAAEPGDGFIALENIKTPKGAIRLASPHDVEQYANEIYEALRLGDKKGLNKIVVEPPSGEGLALAIRNRLEKAAFIKISISNNNSIS
jgi:L-threonylcarbamoyladenylate synthase